MTTAYAYDVQDHLVRVTDGEGNETAYVYSDRDLLTREESPVSGVTAHAYTEHGELRETTDARGVTVTRTVDAADRVTFVDYPGTALDRTYTWGTDPASHTRGRLTAIGNETASIAYAYDAHGRLVQDGDLLFTHDANGNLSTVTYPGGLVASYAHDAMDREQSLSVQPAGGTAVPVVAATPGASYRPFGPLAGLTFGTVPPTTETRSHDFRYTPTGIALSGGQFAWTYATDANGNVLSISDGTGGGHGRSFATEWQQYLTTATGRVSVLELRPDREPHAPELAPVTSLHLRPQPARRKHAASESVRSATSCRCRRVSTPSMPAVFTQTAVIAPFRSPEPTAHLTFDAAGTLTDLAAGGKPLAFGYDGRGLLVRAGMGDTPYALSTYSSEGRLYSLHTIDLASRKTSESRTGLLYFAGRPVAQWREAVGGGGGGALTFLTTDHLGTPACALGEDASVTWSGGFEPFGRDWQEGSAQSALANGIFLRLPGQWDHPFWHRGLGAKDLAGISTGAPLV